jgi:fumarate hydratase subunit beta
MKAIQISTPLSLEARKTLRAGDVVNLSGEIITARDAAHKRLAALARAGSPPPCDLAGCILFYAGPCPARPGAIIGPVAPTTASRMDPFLEMSARYGVVATIGKGERSPDIRAVCRRYSMVYFLGYGGCAALVSRAVKAVRVLAFDDLGPESMKVLRVDNLRLIVGIDAAGNAFEDEQIKRYRSPTKECLTV